MNQEFEPKVIKGIIEALLFVSERPLLLEHIKGVLEGLGDESILQAIEQLRVEYEAAARGIRIVEVAGGYQMVTAAEYALYLNQLYKERHKQKLSTPTLETLAIVAYKQPVTRLEIESIRGVNIEGILKTLLEKGLVRIVGRKDAVGRPFVYGTTRLFLEYFGLRSLKELPKLEDFASLQPQDIELETGEMAKTGEKEESLQKDGQEPTAA